MKMATTHGKKPTFDPESSTTDAERKKYLVCPYFARNHRQAERTCIGPGPGFPSIHRLK
jgi:hypothetical protein